jgi:hypothetical protein
VGRGYQISYKNPTRQPSRGENKQKKRKNEETGKLHEARPNKKPRTGTLQKTEETQTKPKKQKDKDRGATQGQRIRKTQKQRKKHREKDKETKNTSRQKHKDENQY